MPTTSKNAIIISLLFSVCITKNELVTNSSTILAKSDQSNKTYSYSWQHILNEVVFESRTSQRDGGDDLLEAVIKKPCLLLSSLINIFKVPTLLLSDRTLDINFKAKLQSCVEIASDSIFIENISDLNNYEDVIHYKNIHLYISLCTLIPTSNLLRLANKYTTETDHFIWIIFYTELVYAWDKAPKNLIAIQKVPCKFNYLRLGTVEQRNALCSEMQYDVILHNESAHGRWITLATILKNYTTFQDKLILTLTGSPNTRDTTGVYNVVTIIESPFTTIHKSVKYDPILRSCLQGKVCWIKDNSGTSFPRCCIGYCMELLSMIEFELQIKTKIYIVEDSAYGAKSNGTWKGMVGDLVSKKADIVVAALTISSTRSEVIDFSEPYLVGGVGIATLIQKENISFFNFQPFLILSLYLWLSMFGIVVGTCILLGLTQKMLHKKNLSAASYFDILYYIFGLMFQREIGAHIPSYKLSTGVIAISVSVFLLIIMTSYTAALTAIKVTSKSTLPITGFKDPKILKPTSSFTYGTIEDSVMTQMFHDSTDPGWNMMYYFMKDYNFHDTNEAFEKLKRGEINAIIHDYPVIFYYMAKEKDCRIQFAGEPIKDAGYGLAVQKGSLLKSLLTGVIRKLNSEGTLSELNAKWVSSSCVRANTQSHYDVLRIYDYGSLFILLGFCFILSFLIFLMEICYSH